MKATRSILTAAVIGSLALASTASAQFLVNDNFDRADGNLVGTNPTPGPGSVWGAHSGAGSVPVQISSNAIVLTHGSGSREDANIGFSGQSSGVLTATFDVTVSDDTVIGGGTDFEYFAHFFTDGQFNFRSRLDVVAPTGGGDYTFGIASGSSTAESIFPTDFSFDTPVTVSISFDLDSGVGSLTIGATTISGSALATGETLDKFAFRQSTSTNNETIVIDNLTIVPEPSTYALILSALALGFVVARRRRS
jgi:hypothetical protein